MGQLCDALSINQTVATTTFWNGIEKVEIVFKASTCLKNADILSESNSLWGGVLQIRTANLSGNRAGPDGGAHLGRLLASSDRLQVAYFRSSHSWIEYSFRIYLGSCAMLL